MLTVLRSRASSKRGIGDRRSHKKYPTLNKKRLMWVIICAGCADRVARWRHAAQTRTTAPCFCSFRQDPLDFTRQATPPTGQVRQSLVCPPKPALLLLAVETYSSIFLTACSRFKEKVEGAENIEVTVYQRFTGGGC